MVTYQENRVAPRFIRPYDNPDYISDVVGFFISFNIIGRRVWVYILFSTSYKN